MADGRHIQLISFRIHTLKVGNRTIENVIASVMGVEGSLLLGQGFLKRFQKWSINNARRTLEIE